MVNEAIIDYDILQEKNIRDLIKRVNEGIKNGWQPVRGFYRNTSAGEYWQTMVKMVKQQEVLDCQKFLEHKGLSLEFAYWQDKGES